MKKKYLIFIILLLVIIDMIDKTFSQEIKIDKININDFSIYYKDKILKLRSYIYDEINKSGIENIRKGVVDICHLGRGSLFVIEDNIFPGLKITSSFHVIEKIEITDKKSRTMRNISLGMQENDIYEQYGNADEIEYISKEKLKIVYIFTINDALINSYKLIFETNNRIIDKIILLIDYKQDKILTIEDFSIIHKKDGKRYHVMQDMKNILKVLSNKNYEIIKPNNNEEEYIFNDIVIKLHLWPQDEYNISQIIIKGKGWSTIRDIEVGDSKEKLLNEYGLYLESFIIPQVDGSEVIHYEFTNFDTAGEIMGHIFYPLYQALYLDFKIANACIKEIVLSYGMLGD